MSIIRVTLSFLFFFTIYFHNVSAVPTRHVCRPEQRDALLEFKNQFGITNHVHPYCSLVCRDRSYYPNLKTESWEKNSDCCDWEGIKCDAKTGQVVEVDLSCSFLRFHSNSSLFRLINIGFLDLSCNDLHGPIPSSIGDFSHLTTLNLDFNRFSGQIPSSIGNHSHLTTLRLTHNQVSGQIPSSIGNLSHLTFLDISFNQFSGQISSSIGKLSGLESLDFSFNNFEGEIPSSFGSLNQLAYLDLAANTLSGNFPITLLNLTKLSYLDLDFSQFTGMLPPNISSLSKLVYFRARGNAFVGTLPSFFLINPSLTFIDLGNNQLSEILEFGNTNLQRLYLDNNKFRGPIPSSISKLTNLERLDLSYWNTQGPFNISILSHLKSLEELTLSNLNTTTTIDLNAISSFSKSLDVLDLSGNHVLATNKSSASDPPSQLIGYLNLSGCGITEFPELLKVQQNMRTLDISNNKIKGQVPGWLWTLPKLEYVDLSNNTFIGFERSRKHGLSSVLWYLFGSKNNFTGNIPSFMCELGSLTTLDLSVNNFSGSIPACMENLKSNLSVLNLRQNHLSGSLPESVFGSLRSFDVGHNQLVGKLPRSLIHFSTLEVLNVESNNINDTFPFWLSSLQNLQVLVLRSNAFHGPVYQASFSTLKIIDISHNHFNGTLPSDYFENWSNMSSLGTNEDQSNVNYYDSLVETNEDRSDVNHMGKSYYQDSMVRIAMGMVRILKIYPALDFSGNRFEGEIPKSIGLLKELHVLNLSSNAFTGHIPSSMGNLTALESLDVSRNKLSGEIPQELGNLSYLWVLNIRQNRLSGGLPKNVFGSLRSFDVGHNQLVGKLPRSLMNFSALEVLNVESNNINDAFPFWLSSLQNLQVLVLRSNAFHGPVHQASFFTLKIIDISHNHFNGTLPSDYFGNWSNMSSLETNENRSDVKYIGNRYYQDSVVLMIKGVELEMVRILKIYTALDFSGNRFEGEIPKSIGLLKEIHVLNLSSNVFTGHIPSSMGNMTALESLDVSQNKLCGEIPQELGSLSFLAYMNFSHNQLVGLVPGGTQFRTQPCSSFENNSRLFGPALDDDCRDLRTSSSQQYETEAEEEEEEEVFSWIAAAIGFGPGIAFGLIIGYILVSYKPELFTSPFGRNKRRSRGTTTH